MANFSTIACRPNTYNLYVTAGQGRRDEEQRWHSLASLQAVKNYKYRCWFSLFPPHLYVLLQVTPVKPCTDTEGLCDAVHHSTRTTVAISSRHISQIFCNKSWQIKYCREVRTKLGCSPSFCLVVWVFFPRGVGVFGFLLVVVLVAFLMYHAHPASFCYKSKRRLDFKE